MYRKKAIVSVTLVTVNRLILKFYTSDPLTPYAVQVYDIFKATQGKGDCRMLRNSFEPLYSEIFPFWAEISDSDKDYICQNSTAVSYSKGTNIHNGSECSGVILIRKGCLRVYILSEEGKEATLYRLHSGDICMLSASCVLQTITFDVHVDAEEDSDCCVISGSAYSAASEHNPNIKIFTLEKTVERFSSVMWVMQQILFMRMDRRLAIFLCSEAERIGSDSINLTHEQIAKYLGSVREVVSRMLKYFANEGIIDLSRSGVKIVDTDKLRKLAFR